MNTGQKDINKLDYWSLKPPWCQPWSIISFGLIVVGAFQFLIHNIWITGLVLLLILMWWYLFLYIAPSIYTDNNI